MTLEKVYKRARKAGFTETYSLEFDALVSQDERHSFRTIDLLELLPVAFRKSEEEQSSFFFTFESLSGVKGHVLVDLNQHEDPISIEMIEAMELPNLSKV